MQSFSGAKYQSKLVWFAHRLFLIPAEFSKSDWSLPQKKENQAGGATGMV